MMSSRVPSSVVFYPNVIVDPPAGHSSLVASETFVSKGLFEDSSSVLVQSLHAVLKTETIEVGESHQMKSPALGKNRLTGSGAGISRPSLSPANCQ